MLSLHGSEGAEKRHAQVISVRTVQASCLLSPWKTPETPTTRTGSPRSFLFIDCAAEKIQLSPQECSPRDPIGNPEVSTTLVLVLLAFPKESPNRPLVKNESKPATSPWCGQQRQWQWCPSCLLREVVFKEVRIFLCKA